MKNRTVLFLMGLICSLGLLAGCELKGGVEQGRCVAYDADKGTFTIVAESFEVDAAGKARFFYTPDAKTLTYKLPVAKRDHGPKPDVGGLLDVNVKDKTVLVYDKNAMKVRSIAMAEAPKVQENVDAKQVKGKKFPETSADGGVTVYLSRAKQLVTFKVPQDAKLDASLLTFGDDLRVAFLNASKDQALRFMNCTKTSIYKRK